MAKNRRSAPPLTATIFADASFDQDTGIAGWGAWIKTAGRDGAIHGAAFKAPVLGSEHAEILALANALALARSMELLTGAVMIQSDCTNALGCIRQVVPSAIDVPAQGGLPAPRRRKPVPPAYKPGLDLIRELVAATGVQLVTRHVKGHRAGGGRNWVNRECDRVANLHRKAAMAAAE